MSEVDVERELARLKSRIKTRDLRWHVHRESGSSQETYSTEEVKSVPGFPHCLVWREGMADWSDASVLPEFQPVASIPERSPHGTAAVPAPADPPSATPASIAAAPPMIADSDAGTGFFDFWRLLYFEPALFFATFRPETKIPFFAFAYIVFVLGVAIDRMEFRSLRFAEKSSSSQTAFESWPVYWGFAIGSALIFGAFQYLITGWWYRVRVKWCGGNADKRLSRFLNLYSSVLYGGITVLSAVYATWRWPKPGPETDFIDGTFGIIGLCAVFWGIYVSYRGATILLKAGKWRARILFLLLPACIYVGVFVAFFAMMIQAS